MPLEEYHKAMRQGLKEEKEAIARGEEPVWWRSPAN